MLCRNTQSRITAVFIALCGVTLISACDDENNPVGVAQDSVTPPVIVTAKDYARAERFLPWNADNYVRNGTITHHWIGNSDHFWYKRQTKNGGKVFVRVNAADGEKKSAFDHRKIAMGLTAATGELYAPDQLPFDTFVYTGDETSIDVTVNDKHWRCVLEDGRCAEAPAAPGPGDLVSPDGKWAAFLKGPNLWLRSLETGEERTLTTDGEERFAYGAVPGTSTVKVTLQRKGEPVPPLALWSPDSKKLVIEKLDERQVPNLYLIQHAPEDGNVRPVLYRYPYSMPVDGHRPAVEIHIFDIVRGTHTTMQYAPLPTAHPGNMGPISVGQVWWDEAGDAVYLTSVEEGRQRRRLLKINTATGKTDGVIEETSDTFIGGRSLEGIRPLTSGEVVWASERDGSNHLYLYSAKGTLVRQLTSGNWTVRRIVQVDEENRQLFFTASGHEAGEDIYYRYLYVVDLDTGELRLLTPENADHDIRTSNVSFFYKLMVPGVVGEAEASFSSSGRYFIESYSRVDMPTRIVLRKADGTRIATLEVADISALQETGVRFPEPFVALATDGVTPIYGNIYRPSNFDPGRSYPVIDAIYGGPQVTRAWKDFMGALFDPHFDGAQALAEIGFIVITIDGRGTPFRSKAFHDDVYGHLEKVGNLEDHITGIKQLAERYPYMNLDRVGVYGHSGGGYAAARAILAYPDFYKVAVSSSGNHDQRGYTIGWGPHYMGLYDVETNNYEEQANARLADNLKGKLLLVHGELDDNVHPALTIQLADALIQANKDFDLLILPNTGHMYGQSVYGSYFQRRKWDYFVHHLLGAEPPENYRITVP